MTMDIAVSPCTSNSEVLIVTLDRAARRNAMSRSMVDSLLDVLDLAGPDRVGAIVLTGAGTGFCAGSDLAGLAEMNAQQRHDFEAASGLLARCLVAHPVPVLAAVHGFAIGGGLTLAAACDIVVTHPDAGWSLPEVPIGLFPAWGLEAVELRIGRPLARRLSWGIDKFDGAQAYACGLADTLADDPLAHALDIAAKLAALPRSQAAAVKDYFSVTRSGPAADERAVHHFDASAISPQAAASFERFDRK